MDTLFACFLFTILVTSIVYIAGGCSWDMLSFYFDKDYVKKDLERRYKNGEY